MAEHKSWDELLWLYITNDLSSADRRMFERYLAESAARRDEVAQWDKLAAAVQEDAQGRVSELPPLNLLVSAASPELVNHVKPSLNGSSSHKYSDMSMRMERQEMTVSTTLMRPDGRFANKRTPISLTLVAALLAVVIFAGLLFMLNNRPPDDSAHLGAGIDTGGNDQQPGLLATGLPSSTPLPTDDNNAPLIGVVRGAQSVPLYDGPDVSYDEIDRVAVGTTVQLLGQNASGTWYNVRVLDEMTGWLASDVVIFEVVNRPPLAVVTGTPIPVNPSLIPTYNSADLSPTLPALSSSSTPVPTATFTPTASPLVPMPSSLPPTAVPPGSAIPGQQRNPLASITPSVMQPIVSAPARLAQQIMIPNGDIAQTIAWAGQHIITGGYNGISLFAVDDSGSGGASTAAGVIAVAVSPDEERLAALDWEANLTLWDISLADPIGFVVEIADTPLWGDLVFNSDGTRLYSTLGDAVYLESESLEFRRFAEAVRGFPYTNADQTLAVVAVEGNAAVVDMVTLQPLVQLPISMESVQRVAFSDTHVAIFDDRQIVVAEVASGEQRSTVRVGGVVTDVVFSPDGTTLAYLTNNPDIRGAWVWDLSEESPYAAFVFDAILNDLVFSPDSNQLAIASSEGRVFILDM